MKYLLSIVFGLFILLFIGSLRSTDAGHFGGALIQGSFQNNGNIVPTITYYITQGSGEKVTGFPNPSVVVPASSSVGFLHIDASLAQPYTLTWWSNCVPDPAVKAIDTSLDVTSGGHSYKLFQFPTQDVTCPNVGGEPIISGPSCPSPGNTLTFSWNLSGAGPYNVAKYHLFRSQLPDNSPDDNFIQTINSTASSGGISWGGMTPGATYYVRVSAESLPGRINPNSFVSTWSAPDYEVITCSGPPGPPLPPQNPRNEGLPLCPNSTVGSDNAFSNVLTKFNVSGATTAEYEMYTNNNLWFNSLQAHNAWVNLNVNSSYELWYTYNNLAPQTRYSWRVRAGNANGWSGWVNGPDINVPKCTSPGPYNLTTSPGCNDAATFSVNFAWTNAASSITLTRFRLYRETISGGVVTSTLVQSLDWPDARTSHSYSPISRDLYYRFEIQQVAGGLDSSWSINRFTISSCTPPDLTVEVLQTKNNATGVLQTVFTPGTIVRVEARIKNISDFAVSTAQQPTFFNRWDRDQPGDSRPLTSSWQDTDCSPSVYFGGDWTIDTPFAGQATFPTSGFTNLGTINTTAWPNGTYRIRAVTDWGCLIDEGSDDTSLVHANNVKEITFVVDSSGLPTKPANLTINKGCLNQLQPTVTFGWKDSELETSYSLQVKTTAWTSDSGPAPFYSITLGANVTSFTWSASSLMSGVPPLNNTIGYYWRVRAANGFGFSAYVYPPSTSPTITPIPGTSFSTYDCRPNLRVTSLLIPDAQVNQQLDATVIVQNAGPVATSGPFEIALNMTGSLDCSITEEHFLTVPALAAGQSTTNLIKVNMPGTPNSSPGYTGIAYADSDCQVLETSESDNSLTDLYVVIGFDLSVTIDSFSPASPYQGGQTPITANITVSNSASANMNSPGLETFGFWPRGETGGDPDFSTCPSPPGLAQSAPVNATFAILLPGELQTGIPPGRSYSTTITFTAPTADDNYTAYAYILRNCPNVAEYNWANNLSSGKTYQVRTNAWFETTGADICSRQNIALGFNPARDQATYMMVRSASDPNASARWTINNYPLSTNCVDSDVYDYVAERFKQKAIYTGPAICTISSLRIGLNYCGSALTGGGGVAPGGNTVLFVNGDLNITSNVTVASAASHSITFIVSGNINVNTSVTRLDGIYVAGGEFKTTDSSGTAGDQLVINGAVYASDANLNRILSASANCTYSSITQTVVSPFACGVQPNVVHPAEIILYDPKYLVLLNTLIGSPEVNWTEVAP